MAYYDLISENDESTVVAEFEQGFFAAEALFCCPKPSDFRPNVSDFCPKPPDNFGL